MTALHEMPGHLIRRLNQISVALFAARMAEVGIDLTPVQFAALAGVRDHPGIDQATLAGLIAYDRVTIGGVVDRLVAKGLLSREVSPRDRRARVLALSVAGEAVLVEAAPAVEAVQRDLLAGLPVADRDGFVALLRMATDAGNDHSRAPLVPLPSEAAE